MDISVVVSQFPPTGKNQEVTRHLWVDEINFVLKKKHQVKVFDFGEDNKAFSAKDISGHTYRKISVFEDPISVRMYMSLLRDHPDLVIIHALPHSTTLAATVVYGIKKVPIILLVHGLYGTEGLVNKFRNFFVKLCVGKYADHIIALTDFDKRVLIKEWRFSERKVLVVPLGLSDKSRVEIELRKREIMNKGTCFTYLWVGRLIKEKRVDMLIDAFNELVTVTGNKIPVKLVIAGDGPEYEKLQSKVKDYGIDSVVKFLGWIKHEELWKYYLLSDVVVLTSIAEGFPFVIYEAFACGKPVISSNVTGISETVKHEVNGLLFNNKEELTQCLLKVLNDQKLLNTLGENAAETAKRSDIFVSVQNLAKQTGLDLV